MTKTYLKLGVIADGEYLYLDKIIPTDTELFGTVLAQHDLTEEDGQKLIDAINDCADKIQYIVGGV